jgi:deferrochelatase/peroxidase EfeB
MDQRPVSEPRETKPSWKLKAPLDGETQGLMVSGFASLPTGRALFLQFGWADVGDGSWLQTLETIAPVTDADGKEQRATALALSCEGLRKMGLAPASLESFPAPFKEGMLQEDRLRRLGDRRSGEWLKTVIPGGPVWSANTPQRGAMTSVKEGQSDALTATGHTEEQLPTTLTVHALVLLYEKDDASAEAWKTQVVTALAAHQVTLVHELPLELRVENFIAREHFGFSDGVSQPIPVDAEGIEFKNAADPRLPEMLKWNGVPLGDFLMGYTNSHAEIAPGPFAPKLDGGETGGLPPHAQAEGFLDLGRNGSYMVVRELKQDVAMFWKTLDAAAERIRLRDPQHSAHVTADWLAERAVGRDKDGHLLCPLGVLQPDAWGDAQNDFGFFDRDQHGHGCPVGSHVRRSNPRDGLAPTEGQKDALLQSANNHRILRRGRKYGATIADTRKDDQVNRGLLFICLNTDIARQFEFVQQTWLLNRNFATLFDETDPIIGPPGTMTVREDPLRRIIDVETFVQMVGGDYFFLPSMKAITYLSHLKPEK